MGQELLDSEKLWKTLTPLARNSRTSSVAVAYCGAGAPRLLPLRQGSTLIVDASEGTVRAGATCPASLQSFHKKRVNLYSVENLHAKIFIFNRRVIIGSANLSGNSQRVLKEVALMTTDREVRKHALRFIEGLDKKPLGPREIRQLSRIYRPPRFVGLGARRKVKLTGVWLLPLERKDWDDEAEKQADKARAVARKRMTSRSFELQEIHWAGKHLINRLRTRHRVVQVVKVGGARTEIVRDSPIIAIRRYATRRGKNAIIFLEVPRRRSVLRLKALRRKNLALASRLSRLKQPRFDRRIETAHALRSLWPK